MIKVSKEGASLCPRKGIHCLLREAIPVSHSSWEEAGVCALSGRSTIGSTGHDLVWLGFVVGAATRGCLLLPACWRSCRAWSDALLFQYCLPIQRDCRDRFGVLFDLWLWRCGTDRSIYMVLVIVCKQSQSGCGVSLSGFPCHCTPGTSYDTFGGGCKWKILYRPVRLSLLMVNHLAYENNCKLFSVGRKCRLQFAQGQTNTTPFTDEQATIPTKKNAKHTFCSPDKPFQKLFLQQHRLKMAVELYPNRLIVDCPVQVHENAPSLLLNVVIASQKGRRLYMAGLPP